MPKPRDRETMIVVAVGVLAVLIVVAFLVFSPSGGELGRRDVGGPPMVRPSTMEAHAAQFEEDLPEREAGSQQEQAAAVYLLGVMQRNGYVVRLDSVPVSNLVTSTNLMASPPGVDEPRAMVLVPYGDEIGAGSLGFFLELSRALNVAAPQHQVGFTALGAEFADGHLGSRRLARFLSDEGQDPFIVQIVDVGDDVPFAASGTDEAGLRAVYEEVTGSSPAGLELETSPDVFTDAGLERVLVQGDPRTLGAALLRFLGAV